MGKGSLDIFFPFCHSANFYAILLQHNSQEAFQISDYNIESYTLSPLLFKKRPNEIKKSSISILCTIYLLGYSQFSSLVLMQTAKFILF